MVCHTIFHFSILEKLAEGGIGAVDKGKGLNLHHMVAPKFLPTSLASSSDDLARLHPEAEAISAVDHPKIVSWQEELGRGPIARSTGLCASVSMSHSLPMLDELLNIYGLRLDNLEQERICEQWKRFGQPS
jgi:serine/threonine protein kinase